MSLAVPIAGYGVPSLAASGEPQGAAEAVRNADAVWAQAAGTGNVDAWMAFYARDAIVLLPDEPLASGTERIRSLVTRLLQRSHLSITWHPVRLEMAESLDLAYVNAAYELRFDDARGRSVADRGQHTELWRLQTDGTWRCIVDTWNPDGASAAAASAAAPAAAPAAASPVQSPRPSKPADSSKYGSKPVRYEEAVRDYFRSRQMDPNSVRDITPPQQGYVTEITGAVLMRETRSYGWIVRATVSLSDTEGARAGSKTYTFLFRGEEIVATRTGLPAP